MWSPNSSDSPNRPTLRTFWPAQRAGQAVAALQADLPARLNAALDAVLQPNQTDAALEDAERWLTDAVPAFAGPGRWLLARTKFRALG